jgi:hypothetical protein
MPNKCVLFIDKHNGMASIEMAALLLVSITKKKNIFVKLNLTEGDESPAAST